MTRNTIELFSNDDTRAVSPVIGVILMVAITVILAAVIGTFVLGLGQNVSQSTPQAQLSFTVTGNNLTIAHKGGDSITASNIKVTLKNSATGDTVKFNPTNNTKLSVGDSARIHSTNTKATLYWPDDGSSKSSVNDTTNSFNLQPGTTYHITIVDKNSQQLIADQDVQA